MNASEGNKPKPLAKHVAIESRRLTFQAHMPIITHTTVAMAVAGIGVPKQRRTSAAQQRGFFVPAVPLMGDCARREQSLPDPLPGTPTSHGLPAHDWRRGWQILKLQRRLPHAHAF